MNNVHRLATPSLRVAQLVYVPDVTRERPNALNILLGAIAELIMGKVHGLALKARNSLTQDELSNVNPLIKDRLAGPFAFWKDEFNAAWKESEAGKALEFLGERHFGSLCILPPRAVPLGSF